jgi:hypothetical protein
VHDKKAEWTLGVLAELEAADLVPWPTRLRGIRAGGNPLPGKTNRKSQKETNRAHAKVRSPAERANAPLKPWRILRELC